METLDLSAATVDTEDEAEEEEEEEVGGREALAAESLSRRAAEAVSGGFEMCEADSW